MKSIDETLAVYAGILNEHPKFILNHAKNSLFEFQNEHDKSLVDLKSDFNVDVIAAGKSDFDKTLSLMMYIHKELFFPGSNISPTVNNTYEIMKVRKTGALFCSYHATVLTEMLLSIGVKAIKISCLPKDFDGDCHVAVLAYMKEKKKWVFFDPTFGTYFFDENGNPLSILEIREQYINRKNILFKNIQIDKQWRLIMNGVVCESYDEWYRIYMSKNSFRFMFPQKSEFNYSNTYAKYIFTNPLGYTTKNEYDTIATESDVAYSGHFCFT